MKSRIHNILIALAAFAAAVPSAQALQPSAYPASSPLASGRWVRVTTDSEGIFQLSYDKLRQMGFDSPDKVQVWTADPYELATNLFSEKSANPLITVPSMHTSDGRLLFYGQADARISLESTAYSSTGFTYARNHYARTTSYLLTDATDAEPLRTASYVSAQGRPVTSHLHVELSEEELDYASGGGALAQGRKYEPGQQADFTFRLKNWEPNTYNTSAIFSYVMDVASTSTGQMQIVTDEGVTRLKADNTPYASCESPDVFRYANGSLWFTPAEAQEGSDLTLTFGVKSPANSNISYLSADRAMLAYPRANVLDDADPSLVMVFGSGYSATGQEMRFPGAKASMRLWLVDNPRAAVSLEGRNPTGEYISFTLPRPCTRAVAFDPAGSFPEPAVAGPVANQNLHGADTPHLLIVTTAPLRARAEELADMHRRYQGLDVLVVTQEEANNEFTAGGPHIMAVRLLAKMLYDRNPSKFRYLLLYGPSTADNRAIKSTLDFPTLVCYQNDNPTQAANFVKNYASDNIYGMLADGYVHSLISSQPTQVAVGRVSARMESQAADYNAKALRWIQNPITPAQYNSGVLISGTLNNNSHISHCLEVERYMTDLHPDMSFTHVPLKALYPDAAGTFSPHHKLIYEALRRGCGYFSYSGHGAINFIQSAELLDTRSALAEEYSCYPFVMLSSCAQFTYDGLGSSLLETMLLAPRGGAIGGVAACRSVYLNYNQYTCRAVAEAYAALEPGARLGDIYLDARRRLLARIGSTLLPTETQELINNMSYNLAGDPALPMYVPTRSISLDAHDAITPLTPATLSGSVLGADGQTDTGFNGTVTLTLFDGKTSVTTRKESSDNADFTPLTFPIENDIISTATAPVTNGRFSVSVVASEPLYAVDTYRAKLSAVSSDSDADGASGTEWLSILPLPDDFAASTEAPVINSFYAEAADFTSGDAVPESFTVHAVITPGASGINYATAGVTTRARLYIDNATIKSGIEGLIIPFDDSTVRFEMPLSGLSHGVHNLRLLIANNAGLTASADMDIYVASETVSGAGVTADTTEPGSVTLGLDGASGAVAARLVVTDCEGRTVFTSASPELPLRWNCTSPAGTQVSDGLYTARLWYTDAEGHHVQAAPAEFVVLR